MNTRDHACRNQRYDTKYSTHDSSLFVRLPAIQHHKQVAEADRSVAAISGVFTCQLPLPSPFFSPLPVLHAIGSTVAVGVAVSFLAAMLLARPAAAGGT